MRLTAFGTLATVVALGSLLLGGIGAPLTVQASDPAEILVQEFISVTDSPQVLPPVEILVEETIGVTDLPQVLPPVEILVQESISVTDSPQVVPPAVIAVVESIGVTDSPQVVPPAVHDVAVTSVSAPTTADVGSTVTVAVDVENEGNVTETFDVTLKDGTTPIGTPQTVTLAAGATQTLTFSWDTTGATVGSHTLTAEASTVTGETDTADNLSTASLSVTTVNQPPVLDPIGDKSVDEGVSLEFTISATDPDVGDTLTYSYSSPALPPEVSFDSATGEFSWTPTEAEDGTYSATFMVEDNGSPSLSDSETIIITVYYTPPQCHHIL
ncbi:hypothetical protein ES703_74068 [subsurface metagenome]